MDGATGEMQVVMSLRLSHLQRIISLLKLVKVLHIHFANFAQVSILDGGRKVPFFVYFYISF